LGGLGSRQLPAERGYLKGKNVWVCGFAYPPEIGRIAQPKVGKSSAWRWRSRPISFLGGLGAKRLNSLVVEAWPLLLQKGRQFQVIHVTGTQDFERVEELYNRSAFRPKSCRIAMRWHMLMRRLTRWSAGRRLDCSGVLAARRPALLVPYPYASNNHQVYNARVIEESGLDVSSGKPTLSRQPSRVSGERRSYRDEAAFGGHVAGGSGLLGIAFDLPIRLSYHTYHRSMPSTILVVDGRCQHRSSLKENLEQEGYQVWPGMTVRRPLQLAKASPTESHNPRYPICLLLTV